jgi:serpin B
MMSQDGKYRYLETPDLQAISVPYASGRLSMYVLLPTAASNVAKLCQSLTPANWEGWMGRLAEREGTLKLPRFRVEGDLSLDKALKALGMTDAYIEGRADFGPMCGGGVWVDTVRHRTYLRVNETGTEAAAITAVPMMMGKSMMPAGPFTMVVDHPFVCAIRDNKTGALVFLGAIVDPGNAPRIGRGG